MSAGGRRAPTIQSGAPSDSVVMIVVACLWRVERQHRGQGWTPVEAEYVGWVEKPTKGISQAVALPLLPLALPRTALRGHAV